jgi:hypothetical protein
MSKSNKVTCCYDCAKRAIGCHSTCEEYIKQSEEVKRKNEEIAKIKRLKALASAISFDGMQSVKHGHSSRSNILNARYR